MSDWRRPTSGTAAAVAADARRRGNSSCGGRSTEIRRFRSRFEHGFGLGFVWASIWPRVAAWWCFLEWACGPGGCALRRRSPAVVRRGGASWATAASARWWFWRRSAGVLGGVGGGNWCL
ncbi:hypothetical protein Dimus_025209 [Dionaea muscipula]